MYEYVIFVYSTAYCNWQKITALWAHYVIMSDKRTLHHRYLEWWSGI